jgi:hypothetical protein
MMTENNPLIAKSYDGLLQAVVHLLEEAQRSAARSVNAIVTATYWEVGRRIGNGNRWRCVRRKTTDTV